MNGGQERIIDLRINPVVFEAVVAGAFGAALYVLGYYRGERHARSQEERR